MMLAHEEVLQRELYTLDCHQSANELQNAVAIACAECLTLEGIQSNPVIGIHYTATKF